MRHVFIAGALMLAAISAKAEGDQIFSQADVERLDGAQSLDLKDADGYVRLAPDRVLKYHLSFTNKGNGLLTLGGLGIHFFEAHEDLVTFAGGSLHHRLVDIDSDGYKDLIFWGTVKKWSEKGKPLGERPLVAVFHFDPRTNHFVNTVSDPDLYVFDQEVSDAAK